MIREGAAPRYAGVDYGSKLAGTTVIAALAGAEINLFSCERKRDADRFVADWARAWQPDFLFLDAPLSLPGVYRGLDGYGDYFYRVGDRALAAMSPMFLGGLTARAMQLGRQLTAAGTTVYEVYPAALAAELGLDRRRYKKKTAYLPGLLSELLSHLPGMPEPAAVRDWHHFDALLALASGRRFIENRHRQYGDPAEGIIIV